MFEVEVLESTHKMQQNYRSREVNIGAFQNHNKDKKSEVGSLENIICEDENAKISDVFGYFKNSVAITCSYDTL